MWFCFYGVLENLKLWKQNRPVVAQAGERAGVAVNGHGELGEVTELI